MLRWCLWPVTSRFRRDPSAWASPGPDGLSAVHHLQPEGAFPLSEPGAGSRESLTQTLNVSSFMFLPDGVFLMRFPLNPCRRAAPCSRPCRPCRASWTAWGATTSNSMRKSSSCRATRAEWVFPRSFGGWSRKRAWRETKICPCCCFQAGGSDDTVMRYSSQYEERLDPFASFSKRVWDTQRTLLSTSSPECSQ